MNINPLKVPDFIEDLCYSLKEKGFEAYLVGGYIRDMFLGRESLDFDITTSALPQEILTTFPKAKPLGNFGTILLVVQGVKVEITPFRDDAPGRKPQYSFGGSLYTDLARRDFTINSIAYDPLTHELIDPHGGLEDIKAKLIRCTGSSQRIWEDPLRAMRAARFQAQLGFSIDSTTLYTLKAQASKLESISRERIGDELLKLVTGDYPYEGLVTLIITGLMDYIIPELMEGIGMMHYNKPMDVLEHHLLACKAVKNTPALRLAALLHDIGKPRVAKRGGKGLTFPNHHRVSADMAQDILKRLRCKGALIQKVVLLIRHHMFFYTPDSPISAGRKLISRVGWDNIYDLMELRVADRIASGFQDPTCPGLEKLRQDLETLKKENSDYKIKDLAISGGDLIDHLGVSPGPEIGNTLKFLLRRVLDDPRLNTRDQLLALARKL